MADTGEDGTTEAQVLQWPDYLVIAAYFAFVLFVGLWVSSIRTDCPQKMPP